MTMCQRREIRYKDSLNRATNFDVPTTGSSLLASAHLLAYAHLQIGYPVFAGRP